MRAAFRLASLAILAILFAATSLRAEAIMLAWDANTDTDLAGYIVEYGTTAAPFATRVVVGNQTTWTLTGAAAATTYVFRVRAYNTDGIESDPSAEVSWTTALPPGGCTTPDPFVALGGGTCYNGGWLPPGITPPSTTTPPASAPTPAPSSPSGCTTPDPFTALGGGTCYNGGWLPPGITPPSSAPAPAPAPTPAPATPAPSSSGCATPDPFSALGGGTCYNGGWLPPGIPVPGSAPAPQTPTPPAPTPTPTPTAAMSSGCATPDPFTALGGGTCYNGGWLPPGISVPTGGTTQPPAPAPAPTPTPQPTTQSGCLTPNPFVGIPGLIGACYNGGWYPVQGQTGTVRSINGSWVIVGDNGTTYQPTTTLDVSLQQNGLPVFFAGVPLGTQNGATLMSLATISAR